MTHYAKVLLLFLSLGALISQQPSADSQLPSSASQSSVDDARIAANVSETAALFQRRTKKFQSSKLPYPAGQLNSILAGTRQQLLNDLPPDAAPLRAYIMQNFPASVPNVPSTKPIDMRTCGPIISSANDLLNTLKAVNAYRLDLILDSNPIGAVFELKPVAGDKLARASRATLTNVWRGVYNYTVVKEGQKTITGSVNLVREKGNLLRCTFVNASSSDAPLPCELVTAQ